VSLRISVRKSGTVTILDLMGCITFGAAADAFKAQLREIAESAERDVIVNFAEVSQIDSSGVGALVQSYVSLTRGGGTLIVINPVGNVREVFEVTHLNRTIATYTDEAAALASLRSTSAGA